MRVTQWASEVPYKNQRDIYQVDGGLNAIGSPLSLRDGQWSSMYGWDFNYDGSISQHEGDWELYRTVTARIDTVANSSQKIKPFIFHLNQATTSTSYVHTPSLDKWRVLIGTSAFETTYSYTTAGCVPIDFTNVCLFSTQASPLMVCAYLDSNAGTPEISAMVYSGAAMTSYTPAIWGTIAPSQLLTYSNRIFANVYNTISWSRAGIWDEWYGSAGTSSYITEDSGYWVFERESRIYEMVPFGGALYFFGDNNVYRFTGYSPETFSSQMVLPNTGINRKGRACASNNAIYYYSNGEFWEYDGMVTARSVSNGSSINGGIQIGVADGYTSMDMAFDGINIVVRLANAESATPSSNESIEYLFNTKTRMWSTQGSTRHLIIRTQSNQIYRGVTKTIVDGGTYFDITIDIVSNVGLSSIGTYGSYRGANVYQLESRAFSGGPFAHIALQSIWLQYKLDDITTKTDIKIYIEDDTNGTDWILIYAMEDIVGTGSVQTERILIPSQYIQWSEFFRIKIDCAGALMTLYPMTMETRLKVRT